MQFIALVVSALAVASASALPQPIGRDTSTSTNSTSTPSAYGASCSSPGAYYCMDSTPDNGTYGTGIGVCSVVGLVVEHTPCADGTVCKKRNETDPAIFCVPPEFQFCESADEDDDADNDDDPVVLPPANGTFVMHKRQNTTCFL